MRANVLGGGPAGRYPALLVKQAMPGAGVDVYERNRPGDTYGFGVVSSDETLGNCRAADAESHRAIRRRMRRGSRARPVSPAGRRPRSRRGTVP